MVKTSLCYEVRIYCYRANGFPSTARWASEGRNYSLNNFLNHLISYDSIKTDRVVYRIHSLGTYISISNSIHFIIFVQRVKKRHFSLQFVCISQFVFYFGTISVGSERISAKVLFGFLIRHHFLLLFFAALSSADSKRLSRKFESYLAIQVHRHWNLQRIGWIAFDCGCVCTMWNSSKTNPMREHIKMFHCSHFHHFSIFLFQFQNSLCGAHMPFVYFNSDKTEWMRHKNERNPYFVCWFSFFFFLYVTANRGVKISNGKRARYVWGRCTQYDHIYHTPITDSLAQFVGRKLREVRPTGCAAIIHTTISETK